MYKITYLAVLPGLLLWLLVFPAAAQEADCENPLSQSEMNICAGKDWEAADVELNATWKKALARAVFIDEHRVEDFSSAKETLLKAQRAWIEFRDLQCETESLEVAGGTMMPLVHASCLARMTRARTAELNDTFFAVGERQ